LRTAPIFETVAGLWAYGVPPLGGFSGNQAAWQAPDRLKAELHTKTFRIGLKILHINNEKTWRGGERQTLLLSEDLQKLGVDNVIACRRDAPLAAEAEKRSVPITFVGASNPALLRDLLVQGKRYDLLHCHTGRGHSIAAIQGVVNRTPIIVTRRVDFLPSRSAFNRFKFGRASKVVCISQFISKQLHDWGVPADKLAVIPSAVPMPNTSISREETAKELRRRLNIPDGQKLVGNIAAFVPHKDQATLLRAARRIVDRRSDVAIVIVGEGELRPQLEQLRKDLELERSVYLAGFIPEAEKLLPAFDVFAMSSAMEGLGSIVLDAFAAGVPVAATAGGGLPELVQDRRTGRLVPVRDDAALAQAVIELLEKPSEATQLVANAREFVLTQFSVRHMAEQYLSLYRAVLSH